MALPDSRPRAQWREDASFSAADELLTDPRLKAAIEALMLMVEQAGPTMFARVGVMRALNRHEVRVFNPDRKDTHWGKHKLARDR
jgi:hypothetical protein